MRVSLVRSTVMAGFAIVIVSGCGSLPTVSSKVPNWPQSSGMTPAETRATREAEMARYRTASKDNTMTALASNATNTGLGGGGAKAPAPAMPVSSSQSGPSRKLEVAPELPRQPPPVREVPKSETLASAMSSTGNVPQASRYGDLMFVSGLPWDARSQPPATEVRIEEQARLALDHVRSALEANRLTMANIVSMTVYLRDLNDMRAFDAVYATYFKGSQPARSVVEVSRLPNNARIEISAVAGR